MQLYKWLLLFFLCVTEKNEYLEEEEEAIMSKEAETSMDNGVILEEDEEDHKTTRRKCDSLRTCCHSFCLPCRTKYNLLPQNPNCWNRFKFAFLCPPHGVIANYLQFFFLCVICYAVLISVFKDYAMPGGNFFSLFVLFFGSVIGGYLISFLRLPPLLGK